MKFNDICWFETRNNMVNSVAATMAQAIAKTMLDTYTLYVGEGKEVIVR